MGIIRNSENVHDQDWSLVVESCASSDIIFKNHIKNNDYLSPTKAAETIQWENYLFTEMQVFIEERKIRQTERKSTIEFISIQKAS